MTLHIVICLYFYACIYIINPDKVFLTVSCKPFLAFTAQHILCLLKLYNALENFSLWKNKKKAFEMMKDFNIYMKMY